MKNLTFILFLFISLSSFGQEQDSKYIFHWGNLSKEINIDTINGSNSVSIATDLKTLKPEINEPIYLMKNGNRIEVDSFMFSIFDTKRNASESFFQVKNYQPRKAAKFHGDEKIGKFIHPFVIVSMINVVAKDGFSFFVNIALKDNIPDFEPSIKLPDVAFGEIYEFQVISFEDSKTILRIDTTNEKTKHIVKIYSNPEKYEIIHLTDFKTSRRLIGEDDLVQLPELKTINLIKNKTLAELDFSQVHEFTEYSKKNIPIVLHWGDMKNVDYEIFKNNRFSIKEKRYLPEDIIEAIDNPILLNLGYQDFEIAKMRISILPENGIPISYVTDHLNYPSLIKSLENVSNQTSILFDQVFIKGKDEQLIFLPPAFMLIFD